MAPLITTQSGLTVAHRREYYNPSPATLPIRFILGCVARNGRFILGRLERLAETLSAAEWFCHTFNAVRGPKKSDANFWRDKPLGIK